MMNDQLTSKALNGEICAYALRGFKRSQQFYFNIILKYYFTESVKIKYWYLYNYNMTNLSSVI